MKKIILLALFLVGLIASCKEDMVAPPLAAEFDRASMVINWADNIIIPTHEAYNTSTKTLHAQAEVFFDEPSLANLEALRTAWLESYKAWQNVSFFTIGKGMETDVLIDYYTNCYPTKTSRIDDVVKSGGYNLMLASSKNIQGFPALDYLLYGLADTDEAILAFYTTHDDALNYKQYLVELTTRINHLSNEVYHDWANGYRTQFINDYNNHHESSVNMLANHFTYTYQYSLQFAKVGFPSGACLNCNGIRRPSYVEALYNGNISKTLLLEALDAAQDFYNGVPFGGSFEERSTSLYQYLDFLNTEHGGERLCDLINSHFDQARTEINKLSNDFVSDIENRNALFVNINELLQLNNILLKYNMMDALDIPLTHFLYDESD